MSRVIAISNLKGGCSKTTTTINLGAALTKQGQKVLLIDFDPQANLTKGLGLYHSKNFHRTITDIIENLVNGENFDPFADIIHHGEGMDILPANEDLAGFEVSLINEIGRDQFLKRYVEMIKDAYDFILIDCQPSLNTLTINAFMAANGIIIPTQPEMYSMDGIGKIWKTYQKIQQSGLNAGLKIDGILITMMNNQTNYTRQEKAVIVEEASKIAPVYSACIPYTVRLKECSKRGVSILTHSPRSKAAEKYELLAKEVIAREQERKKNRNQFGQLVSITPERKKYKGGNR